MWGTIQSEEYLTPNGRAGIIVPEGIIFQSGSACAQLREVLIRESLISVIPASFLCLAAYTTQLKNFLSALR